MGKAVTQHVKWIPSPRSRAWRWSLSSKIHQGGTFWYCLHEGVHGRDCTYKSRKQAKVRRHWRAVHCDDPRFHPLFCKCLF
jgi:hypothetical protein